MSEGYATRFRGELDEHGQGGYMLCGVEGCPRASEDGQDEMCGLARLYGVLDSPRMALCGAEATVDLWERQGVFATTHNADSGSSA